jgi:hypothetical protein
MVSAVSRLIKWGSECIFERNDARRDMCNYDHQRRETVNIIHDPAFIGNRGGNELIICNEATCYENDSKN